MFIKVVRPGKIAQIENVYECDKYELRFWEEESPQKCLILMKKYPDRLVGSVEIERKNVGVYFMNEQGRTIDSIDWLDHRVDAEPIPEN